MLEFFYSIVGLAPKLPDEGREEFFCQGFVKKVWIFYDKDNKGTSWRYLQILLSESPSKDFVLCTWCSCSSSAVIFCSLFYIFEVLLFWGLVLSVSVFWAMVCLALGYFIWPSYKPHVVQTMVGWLDWKTQEF